MYTISCTCKFLQLRWQWLPVRTLLWLWLLYTRLWSIPTYFSCFWCRMSVVSTGKCILLLQLATGCHRLILWEIIPLSGNKIFSQSWYFWQKNSLEFLFTTIWWWDNAWLSLFLILSKNVRKQDVRKQDFFLKYKFLKIMSNLHRTKSELS